jgi:hypothetical protein
MWKHKTIPIKDFNKTQTVEQKVMKSDKQNHYQKPLKLEWSCSKER